MSRISFTVKRGMITHIEQDPDSEMPNGAVDLTDRFIIPGLIDMHVHIKEGFAPLFTAAGVTTVRNTAGNVIELETLRSAAADAPTPRVISADRMIDGPPGLWGDTSPWSFVTDDPEKVRTEVNRQISQGADLIKVYSLLDRSSMAAAAVEAARGGKDVSCDLLYSTEVTAVSAAELGIRWNEHASGIIQDLYPGWHMGAPAEEWERIDWEGKNEAEIRTVCRKMIDAGVVLCPTITLFDQQRSLPDFWKPEGAEHFLTPALKRQFESLAEHKEIFNRVGQHGRFNQTVSRLYKELGGTVTAGTDTPAGVYTYPGLALHRELELLVDAGFTEAEAIKAATSTAADALGRHELGRIIEGAAADFVVLEKNPFEDIRHTRSVRKVVKGGRLYLPEELVKAVPDEEEAVKKSKAFAAAFKD
ncbi:amidohydrolase family protein [Alteribacter lacisalsi]|nr:amidohydrolase family protein [Alteribacter lacisalsi]